MVTIIILTKTILVLITSFVAVCFGIASTRSNDEDKNGIALLWVFLFFFILALEIVVGRQLTQGLI